MKILGVIGGLGPMATAYFLQLVTQMTAVDSDQDHIIIYMQSIPNTPDRTTYILNDKSENPLPFLVKAGRALKKQGADLLAIPCVTAHYFQKKMCQEIGIPVIDLPTELAIELQRMNVKKVGILATSGTIESGFLQQILEKHGIEVCVPEKNAQEKIMEIIYQQIKAGKEADVETFVRIGRLLKEQGAEKLILGCTELSLLKRDYQDNIAEDYIDVLEVLAKIAIQGVGASLKENFK